MTPFCPKAARRMRPKWPLIASEVSLSRPEAVAALAPSRIWFVSVVYPASLQNATSCPGQNVYTPFGHSRGRHPSCWINGLRHSSALSVVHRQNRPSSSKPLIHNAFTHPARGASCVGRLRPQMSASEFGDKRPRLTGNRAGGVTQQGPRRSLGHAHQADRNPLPKHGNGQTQKGPQKRPRDGRSDGIRTGCPYHRPGRWQQAVRQVRHCARHVCAAAQACWWSWGHPGLHRHPQPGYPHGHPVSASGRPRFRYCTDPRWFPCPAICAFSDGPRCSLLLAIRKGR